MERRPLLKSLGIAAGIAGIGSSSSKVAAQSETIDPIGFDSTASLLNASQNPLTDSSIIAVQAESTATNVDEDGNSDVTPYPAGTDIPLVAIDGQVAGLGTPLVPNDIDFGFGTEEFYLNLLDELVEGGRVLWDEGHSQFYNTGEVSTFISYAEGESQFQSETREFSYTVEATTDIQADLGGADAVVITTPSTAFSDAEITALTNFIGDGGVVILHTQSDFSNFDETANINSLAAGLGVNFRFNDGQVLDEESNAGADFVPITTNFNQNQFPGLFENRPGIDESTSLDPTEQYTVTVSDIADGDTVDVDFVNRVQTEEIRVLGIDTPESASAASAERPTEWEGLADRVGLTSLQFGSSSSLLNAARDPLEGSDVAVFAEPSATSTDADGNGDAIQYPDDASIPLAAIDGGVAGFGAPLVNDGALAAVSDLDNEEFLLNVWDALLGGGSTVRWDESHGQFYDLSKFSTFQSYAQSNGYTIEAGTTIPADTTAVDGIVITTPSDTFSDSELSDLSSFVEAGGAVLLHDQSDNNGFDATANLNDIATALDLSFRFNDDQVEDAQNNTGELFRPTTTQFVTSNELFREREGVDSELVIPADGSVVTRLAFSEGTGGLVTSAGDPLTDTSLIPVSSEPSATNEDSDGRSDATNYPDGESIPLVGIDGRVIGIGSPFVTDDTLNSTGGADNEEFLLNLWDSKLGGSGTVRWDEGHSQFYDLSKFSTFETYAEENGYTVESGTAIPGDTSSVSGLVVTSPSDAFSDAELSTLSSFVTDGGIVFLFDQSDNNDFDETANLNQIASKLDIGFNFDDSQVFDTENNTGDDFRPVTENLNTQEFSLFAARPGVDDTTSGGFFENEFPYLSYWGKRASEFAVDELEGKTVDISFDPDGSTFNDGVRDPFGRVLAFIEYDADNSGSRDTSYNRRVIENGLARSYGSSFSRLEEFLEAEQTARDTGAGMWRQSNPTRTPTIRNSQFEEVYLPKAEQVTSQAGALDPTRVALRSPDSAAPSQVPLAALDQETNVVTIGGLLIDEAYEQAEGFETNTSDFGNFPFVGNLIAELSEKEGPVLIAGGQGQFNTGDGLSIEDVAYFQQYLEGLDVNLEGINDLTASRLTTARALVLSTPLVGLTDAELTALSAFTDSGGAVILLSSADASESSRARLNTVATELGTDLQFTGQAVTDNTANLANDETVTITQNFSGATSLTSLYGPYSPGVDQPGLSIEFFDNQVGRDGTVSGDVVLSDAPDGLAGYEITVEVADTSIVEFTGATYPDVLGPVNQPQIAANGSAVTIAAADTDDRIPAGATDIRLGQVEVTAQNPGTTTTTITVDSVDDDAGNRVAPATGVGEVTVASIRSVDDGHIPTDIDDDGIFEDVNGDRKVSYNDVVVLFQNRDDPAVTNRESDFDLNGNGRIDFDDIVELFDEVGPRQ